MKNMNESRGSLIQKYANLIMENDEQLIHSISDDIDNISEELTELGIPEFYKYDAFELAKECLLRSGLIENDCDLDDVYEAMTDSDMILHVIYESEAADKAKAKGLVHLGFGMWGKKEGGTPMFKSVDGKLVPASSSAGKSEKSDGDKKDDKKDSKSKKKDDKEDEEPKNDKKDKSEDDEKSEKSKKDDDDKKPVKKGIHDIKRISGKKYKFSYTLDGRPQRILFTTDEIDRLTKKSDTIKYIIQTRLEKLRKKKKSGKMKFGTDNNKIEPKSEPKNEKKS